MQTFLPAADFRATAAFLDNRRLGKQRVECKQIYRALTGQSKGWTNHPATKMWRSHEGTLLWYAITICEEWRDRGFKDSLLPEFEWLYYHGKFSDATPAWLGDVRLHASHRSNLLRKDSAWYGKYNWTEGPDLEYYWPT